MNDVRPERAWFEKADQDLEMTYRAWGKILKILKSCQSRFRQIR